MMRSLFSGISGLRVHQTKMDVIGNNISNVNTVGFRASSVNFTDVFYQTTQNASGPNANTGAAGTNAMQIGLGANVAAITVDLSGSGSVQRTDRGMDVMIQGDAFFIVRSNGNTYFTKSGLLDVDAAGTLMCHTNGASVLGWRVDENGEIRKDTVDTLNLMGPENKYSTPNPTTAVTMVGNVDNKDSQVAPDAKGYPMDVNFFDNLGQSYTAKMKLVKTSAENDNIFSITITDVQGPDGKSILRQKGDDGKWEPVEGGPSINFGGTELGPDNYEVDPDTGEVTITGINAWPQLTFDANTGLFQSVGDAGAGGGGAGGADGEAKPGILNLTLSNDGLTKSFPANGVDINYGKLTMYASDGRCSVKPVCGDADDGNAGAGNAAGSLDGFSVQPDGKIYGVYTNGDKKLLGQIAVATFANPSGLESVGNSMYASTLNSGDFDGVGVDVSEVGKLAVGALEMSDVDMATEFTNMITTQRGFQANSRIITTSDSMLEELVNLKR